MRLMMGGHAAEFGANVFRPADLDLYFNRFIPEQIGRTPSTISVEGSKSHICFCIRTTG